MITLGFMPWVLRSFAHGVARRAHRRGGYPTHWGIRLCAALPFAAPLGLLERHGAGLGMATVLCAAMFWPFAFGLLDAWRGCWLPLNVVLFPLLIVFALFWDFFLTLFLMDSYFTATQTVYLVVLAGVCGLSAVCIRTDLTPVSDRPVR